MKGARLGVDLEFLPAADFEALKAALPEVVFTDGSEVLRRLRCIKSPREITCLRQANAASEAGLLHMAQNARAGIALGANLVAPDPVLQPSDLIKADMGVEVDGYLSDGTRTYSLGNPRPAASRLFGIIEEAFMAGLSTIRPGAAFCDVPAAVLATTARLGLPDYNQGHFGHSIGASCGSEEWPFISASNPEEIQPGMVLAFEVPFYLHGLGAMMIEDQLLVTATGVEVMNRLPRGLVDITQMEPAVA